MRGSHTLLVVSFLFLASTAPAEESLLHDGDFTEWDGGKPSRWEVSVGASRGKGPRSEVTRIDGGGVRLRGDISTQEWSLLSQSFPCEEGACYRLTYEAFAEGVKLEAGQFDSCYAGVVFSDAQGKALARSVQDIEATKWTPDELFARAPKGTKSASVAIFLGKTGALSLHHAHVKKVTHSFDVLVHDMDRHYSHFEEHCPDWERLASRYRERAEAATDPKAFAAVVTEMLAELKDLHITVEDGAGKKEEVYLPPVKPNVEFSIVRKRLKDVRYDGPAGIVATTAKGHGYLASRSLMGEDAEFQKFDAAFQALLDAKPRGLLVDLRADRGGEEVRAQRIANRFTSKAVLYERTRVRSGPGHSEFSEPRDHVLQPRAGATPPEKLPIVCLTGPLCVSSGEQLAAMFKVIPGTVLVGQPTGGSSGNPLPVELPNGVRVHYPRWEGFLPDGTRVEGNGVAPDVVVKHEGEGDPTLDAAARELEKLLGK